MLVVIRKYIIFISEIDEKKTRNECSSVFFDRAKSLLILVYSVRNPSVDKVHGFYFQMLMFSVIVEYQPEGIRNDIFCCILKI